jgi:hypothetical protein
MPGTTHAHVLAAPARPTQRPPSTPPPRRCPRCYGHHSSAGICRGRPVPGVTPGANQSPSMPSSLDASHPSAPCAYHSSFRGQARHTNSECSRSSSGSPSKRPRNSPSPGGRSQAEHRGQVRGSAMVAAAWPVRHQNHHRGMQFGNRTHRDRWDRAGHRTTRVTSTGRTAAAGYDARAVRRSGRIVQFTPLPAPSLLPSSVATVPSLPRLSVRSTPHTPGAEHAKFSNAAVAPHRAAQQPSHDAEFASPSPRSRAQAAPSSLRNNCSHTHTPHTQHHMTCPAPLIHHATSSMQLVPSPLPPPPPPRARDQPLRSQLLPN